MDTLEAKHPRGAPDSGCERVAHLVLVWATRAGVHPGVGHRHPRSRPGPHRKSPGARTRSRHGDRGPNPAWPDDSTGDSHLPRADCCPAGHERHKLYARSQASILIRLGPVVASAPCMCAAWSLRSDLDVHLHTIVVGRVLDSSIPTGARTLDAYARVDLAGTGRLPGTGRSSLLSITCLIPLMKNSSASQPPA